MTSRQLLKDPRVIFSGYRIPHPMDYRMELRVQTNSSHYSPSEALESAIRDLIAETAILEERFVQQVDQFRPPNQDTAGYL